LGPLDSIDLIVVDSGSSGSETDELDTGSDDSDSGSTSKSEKSRNLNSHATERSESVDSVVDPAPIPTVGKRKRGRLSKETIEPGEIINNFFGLSSLLTSHPYSSSCRKNKDGYLPYQLVLFSRARKTSVTSQRPQHWPGIVNQRALGYSQSSTIGQDCC
jgi:hypothetical protein